MTLKFEVSGRVNRPVDEVFDAVANPAKLSGYFTTGGASERLETGVQVYWDFHDFPGAFPVQVVEVEANKRIVLQWEADAPETDDSGSNYTTVIMRFEPIDGDRTLVSISEEGFRRTPAGEKASYMNCQGWMQMICAMKAYVEHGINLRDGMFK